MYIKFNKIFNFFLSVESFRMALMLSLDILDMVPWTESNSRICVEVEKCSSIDSILNSQAEYLF